MNSSILCDGVFSVQAVILTEVSHGHNNKKQLSIVIEGHFKAL